MWVFGVCDYSVRAMVLVQEEERKGKDGKTRARK